MTAAQRAIDDIETKGVVWWVVWFKERDGELTIQF